MIRVLLIDDDEALSDLLTEYFAGESFQIEAVHSGECGIVRALSGEHEIIVLDVMLPGVGGFEILKRIRAEGSRIPVLMLTARKSDVDRILGLELGADDYLPKPFNPRELIARIRAILRRTQADTNETKRHLRVGNVDLDKGTRTAKLNSEILDLTAVEYDLLALLMESAGIIVTRKELMRNVLGREVSPFDRSLDMHVSNLRRKLNARPAETELIKTIRGVGFIYTRPENT